MHLAATTSEFVFTSPLGHHCGVAPLIAGYSGPPLTATAERAPRRFDQA
jgi:hypothetical protein